MIFYTPFYYLKKEFKMLIGKTFNNYTIISLKTVGGRSQIYECINNTGHKFIFKTTEYFWDYEKNEFDENTGDIYIEKYIFENCKHQNILSCIENFAINTESTKFHCFILPLYEGDLKSYKYQKFTNKEKLKIILQISSAIEYLHAKKIYHGDIKPQNILLDKEKNAILCDFSLSANFNVKTHPKNTLGYCTPFELYNQKFFKTAKRLKLLFHSCLNNRVNPEDYFNENKKILLEDGASSDIWAFAILISEIIFERHIFNTKEVESIEEKIENYLYEYEKLLSDPHIYLTLKFERLNVWLQHLLCNMLQIDPNKRPTAKKIKCLIAGLLVYEVENTN